MTTTQDIRDQDINDPTSVGREKEFFCFSVKHLDSLNLDNYKITVSLPNFLKYFCGSVGREISMTSFRVTAKIL